jgi:hypothetical protein
VKSPAGALTGEADSHLKTVFIVDDSKQAAHSHLVRNERKTGYKGLCPMIVHSFDIERGHCALELDPSAEIDSSIRT